MGFQIGGIAIPTTRREVQDQLGNAGKWGANGINKLTGAETIKVPAQLPESRYEQLLMLT